MEIFAALADPTRLRIFELLAQGEKTAGDIMKQFSFTPPAISQHLKVLRTAEVVRVRADGQRRYYTINPEALQTIEQWTQTMTKQWNNDLDALERVLQDEKRRRKTYE